MSPAKKSTKPKTAPARKARAPAKKKAAARKAPAKKKAAARKAAAKKPNTKAAEGARRKSISKPARPGRSPAGGAEQQQLFEPDPKLAAVLDERLLVPQRVAALAFDITVEALKKWKIRPVHRRGREALYNLRELIAYRMERVDANEHDLIKNRARLAKTQAEESELRVEQLRGNLIPADVLLENWEPLVGAARQKVLAIPAKLKAQIPALTDDEIKIITEVCRGTLEDLANGGIPRSPRAINRPAL